MLLFGVYVFYGSGALRLEAAMRQRAVYYGLLAALVLLGGLLYWKKGRRLGLLTTAMMALGGLMLPGFAAEYAWLPNDMRYVPAAPELAASYLRFGRASPAMAAAAVGVVALIVAVAMVKVRRVEKPKGG